MCLAIPGRICELVDDQSRLAAVDVMGVRRNVNVELLRDDPPHEGDWVLIHVGFAMSKISGEEAEQQLTLLRMLDEGSDAEDEAAGYQLEQ